MRNLRGGIAWGWAGASVALLAGLSGAACSADPGASQRGSAVEPLAATDAGSDGDSATSGGNGGTCLASFTAQPWTPLPAEGRGGPAIITDLNGDGSPDVLLTMVRGVLVMAGTPGGGVGAGSMVESSSFVYTAAVGDLDGDGHADLALLEDDGDGVGGRQVVVLPGDGAGGFGAPHATDLGLVGPNWPATLALADFDGDGHLDVAVGLKANVGVMLGKGDGTLAAPIVASIPGVYNVYALSVTDLNGDGAPDLVSTGWYTATGMGVFTQLGIGGGALGAASKAPVVGAGTVALGDFNSDGFPDMVVGQGGSASWLVVMAGHGDGTFASGSSVTVTGNNAVAVDVNRDGALDIVTETDTLLGHGDGSFTAAPMHGAPPGTPTLFDMTGDGALDLVSPFGASLAVIPGHGDGTFAGPELVKAHAGPLGFVAAGDFNGDGKLDLVAAGSTSKHAGRLTALLGRGNGTFTAVPNASAPGWMLNVADLDGDHADDLVLEHWDDYSFWSARSLGDGHFAAPVLAFKLLDVPTNPVVRDLDGDGTPDLAVGGQSRGQEAYIQFAHGLGDGTFAPPVKSYLGIGNRWQAIVGIGAGDLDGNGVPDMVISGTTRSSGLMMVALGRGDGTFVPHASINPGAQRKVMFGDLNGDGKLDVVTATVASSWVLAFLGDGTGGLAEPLAADTGAGWLWDAQLADADGDGRLDVVAVGGASVVLLHGNGDGTFAAPRYYLGGPGPGKLVLGDWNADGKTDVVTLNGGESLDLLLGGACQR